MANPRDVLSPNDYTNYRNIRAVSVLFVFAGSIILFGSISSVFLGPSSPEKQAHLAVAICLVIAGIAGFVGGIAALCGNRRLAPLVYVMAAVYVFGFPIGTILSIVIFRGLSRYLDSVDRIRAPMQVDARQSDELLRRTNLNLSKRMNAVFSPILGEEIAEALPVESPPIMDALPAYSPATLSEIAEPPTITEMPSADPAIRFKTRTNLGVGLGILAMILASGAMTQGPAALWAGMAMYLGGWASLLWGCVNYVCWKGYSGWLGFLGYLLLPGLLILACLPNRRKRLITEEQLAEGQALAVRDRIPGYRYLLTLVPLPLVFLGIVFASSLFHSLAKGLEWQPLSRPDLGFQAMMPATPRIVQDTQDAGRGLVVVNKFIAEPKGKKEVYVIASIRFLSAKNSKLMAGKEKLLELGKNDLIRACKGKIQSEKRISSGRNAGFELEILLATGSVVKARIYARGNQVFELFAQVPKSRLASGDVGKFFDSFRLSDEPTENERLLKQIENEPYP